MVKVRVIRAQSTWSLEKFGYNCCNLCSTYTPGNPHIPPLEKEIIFKIAFSGHMTVSGSVSEYLQEKLMKISKVGFWVAACLFLIIGIPHTGYPIKTTRWKIIGDLKQTKISNIPHLEKKTKKHEPTTFVSTIFQIPSIPNFPRWFVVTKKCPVFLGREGCDFLESPYNWVSEPLLHHQMRPPNFWP